MPLLIPVGAVKGNDPVGIPVGALKVNDPVGVAMLAAILEA
jgi:hypothetical protein